MRNKKISSSRKNPLWLMESSDLPASDMCTEYSQVPGMYIRIPAKGTYLILFNAAVMADNKISYIICVNGVEIGESEMEYDGYVRDWHSANIIYLYDLRVGDTVSIKNKVDGGTFFTYSRQLILIRQ